MNVTVHIGELAVLECRIRNLGPKQVSHKAKTTTQQQQENPKNEQTQTKANFGVPEDQ